MLLKVLSCSVGSGAMIITIGGAARYLDRRVRDNKYWSSLLNCDRETKFPFLFELQVCKNSQICLLIDMIAISFLYMSKDDHFISSTLQSLLVGLASAMVLLSTSHRTKNQELLALHQLINWLIAGIPFSCSHSSLSYTVSL